MEECFLGMPRLWFCSYPCMGDRMGRDGNFYLRHTPKSEVLERQRQGNQKFKDSIDHSGNLRPG